MHMTHNWSDLVDAKSRSNDRSSDPIASAAEQLTIDRAGRILTLSLHAKPRPAASGVRAQRRCVCACSIDAAPACVEYHNMSVPARPPVWIMAMIVPFRSRDRQRSVFMLVLALAAASVSVPAAAAQLAADCTTGNGDAATCSALGCYYCCSPAGACTPTSPPASACDSVAPPGSGGACPTPNTPVPGPVGTETPANRWVAAVLLAIIVLPVTIVLVVVVVTGIVRFCHVHQERKRLRPAGEPATDRQRCGLWCCRRCRRRRQLPPALTSGAAALVGVPVAVPPPSYRPDVAASPPSYQFTLDVLRNDRDAGRLPRPTRTPAPAYDLALAMTPPPASPASPPILA